MALSPQVWRWPSHFGPHRESATVPTEVSSYILPVAHVPPPETRSVQPVRLLFRSATALEDVTIEIDLPDGAELRGYPGSSG